MATSVARFLLFCSLRLRHWVKEPARWLQLASSTTIFLPMLITLIDQSVQDGLESIDWCCFHIKFPLAQVESIVSN